MAAKMCSMSVEDAWGPVVESSCLGGFDFTLLFEEAILTVVPLAVIASWCCLRTVALYNDPVRVSTSWLLPSKLTGYAVLVALQIALLALWAPSRVDKTRTTLATAALTLVVSIILAGVSFLEHTRSIRPSSAITICLGVTVLLDVARVRTLFYIAGHHQIASIFLASFAVKVAVFALELIGKRRLTQTQWKQESPETTAGVYNRSLLFWLNRLFVKGYRTWLTVDQLTPVDADILAASQPTSLIEKWDKSEKSNRYALLLTFLGHYKWSILAGVLPRLCYTGFTFAQPFLIERALDYTQEPVGPNSRNIAYGLIGAYAIVYIGIAVSFAVYEHKTYRALTKFRGSLIALIFRKTLRINASAITDAEAITMMSADIDRIGLSMRFLHEWYVALIELGLSLWLLYRLLSVAMAAAAAFTVFMLIVSAPIAAIAGNAQNPWLNAIEDRLASTAKALGVMIAIRQSGLTGHVATLIARQRIDEIAASRKYRIWNALINVGFYISSTLTPVWGFGVYIVLARARGTATLTEGVAFAALSLFQLQDQPTINLVDGFEHFQTLTNCFERIQEHLEADGHEDCRDTSGNLPASQAQTSISTLDREKDFTSTAQQENEKSRSIAATLHSVSVWYEQEIDPIVRDITLEIAHGTTTVILGPVGCGKSTLLKVLLGEVNKIEGEVYTNFSTSAYCPQAPWITWGSVRDNILGMSAWDAKWYDAVVEACGLLVDFAAFPKSDQMPAGVRGSRLSGGQQMRVSLARAVYSKQPVLILDDVLTGLDSITETAILENVFGPDGLLKKSKSTVVLATNSVNHCRYADNIVILDKEGRVIEQGTFESLSGTGGIMEHLTAAPPAVTARSQLELSDETLQELQEVFHGQDDIEQGESRSTGDLKVYAYYTRIAGWGIMAVYLVLCIAFIFGLNFSSVWVQRWTNANAKHPNEDVSYWLGIYAAIAAIAVVGSVSSDLLFKLVVVPKTSMRFHDLLLSTTMGATLSFLTSANSGTTTNRFSQDLQLIDNDLPEAFDQTIFHILSAIAGAILVFIGSGYVAAAIPACLLFMYLIQVYYLRTSRQLRLLDIEAKAPLFSQFLETLGGVACIRAYGWADQYLERNVEILNYSQKPYYLLWCIQRWLTLVLDLFVAGVAVLLVAIATNVHNGSTSYLGTALFNVVSFSMTIQLLVAEWTQLETAIGAVNRVRAYVANTAGEDLGGETEDVPQDWPAEGNITFTNVSASYDLSLDPVLNGISFSIQSGEKVALCGRTGSGKSSLTLALLHMIHIAKGTIAIDGIDISTISRSTVRSRLNAVPQESIFIRGTLRENVNPHGEEKDERIIKVLGDLGLWESLKANGGLDDELNEDSLSHGQRQLLCLARAVLRPGQIVVLDEVASSVDDETEALMQKVLRREFAGRTILAVAHKLASVLDFDKVVVLEKGSITEMGNPRDLLNTPGSRFKAQYEQ